jgi:signal transduction histidine kinase
MGLPELTGLTLEQTLERVVKSHERRTGTQVRCSFQGSPQPNSLSIKIITYRLVQEALNNSFRHAGGKDQRVRATWDIENIFIEVSDHGPGFNVGEKIDQEVHTGLSGMRNRVDSIGGRVEIESKPGSGTILRATIPLQTGDESNE